MQRRGGEGDPPLHGWLVQSKTRGEGRAKRRRQLTACSRDRYKHAAGTEEAGDREGKEKGREGGSADFPVKGIS